MDYQNKSKEELIIELQNLNQELSHLKDSIDNPFKNDNLAQSDFLRSESRWRFAIEEALDGVWEWDLLTDRAFYSKQWKEMLGYSDSGIGNTVDEWGKHIHPDDLEVSLSLLNKHLSGIAESYISEHRVICKDGLNKWVLETGKVIARDNHGNPLRMVGSHKDVTQRKNTEFALRESELKYHTLIENIGDVLFEVDIQGNIKFISSPIEKITGYTPAEILGKNFKEFVGENSQIIHSRLQELDEKKESSKEYQIFTKNREPRWIRLSSKAIYKDGQMEGATGTLIDITEKKLVELELQESESLYRSVLNSSPDTITITDLKGKILFISLQGFKMFKYNHPEDTYHLSLLDFLDPGDRQRAADNLAEMFCNKQDRLREFKGLRSDGTTFDLEVKGDFTLDNEGKPVQMVFISRDISARKLSEVALTESEEKFSSAFLTAPYAITITGTEDGRFIEVNDSFSVHTGYSREEAYSDSAISLNLWKNSADREEIIRDLKRGKNVVGREYEFIKKDGSVVICMYSASLLFLRNTTFILSSITDITDKKIASQKIEKMSRLYMVISNVNQAIIHFRTKDLLIHEICRIAVEYGKFKMAWIGLVDQETQLVQPVMSEGFEEGFFNVFKPISVSENPHNRGPIGAAINAGNHFVFDNLMTDPRVGDWKEEALKRGYLSSITLPLKQFGKIAGTFTLYSEIPDFFISEEIALLDEVVNEISFAFEAIETENERKQTENQLRKLSTAVEQSPVSIVITDLDGNIEYVNPKTLDTTGYSLEELIGINPRVLKSGETKDQEYETLWGNISTGKEWRGTFHNKRKSGELYWESSTITHITDINGEITHYLGVKEDITARVLIQEALMKSEERFHQIATQSQTVFWEVDQNGLFTYVDQVSETVWGYKSEELVGKMYFYDLHPREGLDEFKQLALQTVSRKESLFNFENQIVTKDGKIIWVSTNEIPILNEQNNVLGYRGADYDITARKQVEDELRKFRTIADQANYGTAITSLDGSLIYLNEAFAKMHGYEAHELNEKSLTIFHNEEQLPEIIAFLEILNTKGSFAALEVWHTRKDGSVFPTLMNASVIYDANNLPQFFSATAVDISDLKQKEEALLSSEQALNSAQELAKMGNWEHNLVTGKLTGSKNYYRLLGLEPNEKLEDLYDYFINLVHPEDLKIISFLQQHQFVENDLQVVEFRLILPDGSVKWIHHNILPLFENGQIVGLKGVTLDITQNKLDAEKIAQSEIRYKALFEKNYTPMFIIDSGTGEIKDVNPATCQKYGWSREEMCAKNIMEIDTLSPEKMKIALDYSANQKQTYFAEKHRLRNGEIRDMEVYVSPVKLSDTILLYAIVHDITDRLLTEKALVQNENELSYAQEIAGMGSYHLDVVTNKVKWSKNLFRLLGVTNSDRELKNDIFMNMVHPDDRHLFIEPSKKKYSSNKDIRFEFRVITRNGEIKWMQNYLVPVFDGDSLISIHGVNIDITAKKRDEENIRQQNERLSAIINAIPDLLFVLDNKGTILEFFTSEPERLLLPADQFIGSNVKDLFDEETAKMHLDKISECIGEQRLVSYDYSAAIGKSASYYEARMTPLGLNKVLSFVRDITERKRNDEAIKKLSLAVEQSPVSIVITDLAGNIEYVNSSFEKTTQFNYDEIRGQNVRVLKSGKTDRTIYENLWKTIEAGNGWSGEWLNKKKNGELFWENISISPIHDDSGIISNYLAVKQDITSNKKAEQEIRDLNVNLELKIEARTSELAAANLKLVDEIEERIRMEGALKNSEQSYRTVVENVNEVIFQTDANGLWLFLNKSWEEVTGFTVADSVGQLFLNYVHPEDRERNLELFEPLICRKKEYCRHEIRYLTKDGGFRWVEVFARLGVNENDEITGTYGTLLDITERKRAEEALLLKTSELENFFTVSLDLLLISDLDGNFIKFNGTWETILGYSSEELSSKRFLDLIHPDDLDITFAAINRLKEQLPLTDFINRYITKDGTVRNMEWNAALVDNLIYAAGRDITERKRAEEFEDELLQLSPKLTGIPQQEIAGALNLALSRIGQFLGADRSYIFEFNADQSLMNNTYEWCNEGINPEIENLQEVPCEILPEWMKVIRRHEKIIIPSVEDLPKSWKGEREILEPQGIQSLIIIPMLSEQNLIGFVGLDSVKKKRVYNPSEINNLTVWSSMLASLINDQRSEQLLEQTRQNYETFFNTIDDFLFVIDQQGNIIHTNNTVNSRLECSRDELFNQSILAVHPPDRREEANRIVGEMLAGTTEYCPVPIVTKSGVQIPVETRVKPGFWNGQQVIFGVSKDISQIKLSEQKFSSAFHSNSALMAISKVKDGRFIDVNDTFIRKLGYARDKLLGKTPEELELYADLTKGNQLKMNIAEQITIREVELEIRKKSGDLIVGLFSADYIYIGDELCVLAVMVDITERKQAIDELEESRETHRGLSEAAFDSIFFSEKGICIEQNQMAEKVFGYTTQEALGRYGTEWIVPEDRDLVMKNMLAGVEEPYEVTALRKDGTSFPCMLSGKMMYYKGRNVRVTSLNDITERKKAEEALLESQNRFSLFMDYLPALVFLKDIEGRMIYANNSIDKALGASNWIGKSLYELFDTETADRLIADDQKTIQSGYQSIEESFINLDGTLHHYETQKFVIPRLGKESIIGGIALDITERKKAEEEIIKSRNEAESANHAKSEFLSRMSHELRTPMNSILGFAQLLQMGTLESRQRKGVNHILHSGKHLLDLINEVLDISRIEAGRIALALEPIQLYGIILEMIDSVQLLAKARSIKIELLSSPLNNTYVLADNQRLKQVFMNLLSNSIKYDKEGGSVIIKVTESSSKKLNISPVRIAFTDTGIGIAAGDILKLFTPFERIGAEKTEIEGTGLGLTVVKKLMDAMGGQIGVESIPGVGSTFWIELPVSENQPEGTSNPAYLKDRDSILPESGGTILYIEDNRSNIELVEQILADHRSNIRLFSTMNGKQAVPLALEVEPDLILLDLDLPDINGDEVIALLKAEVRTKAIPVIIISADAMSQQQEKLFKAGARNYLTKPLDVPLFLLEVDKWIG